MLRAVASTATAVVIFLLFFTLYMRGTFDRSPKQTATAAVSEADRECLAASIWDATQGSRSTELSQILVGIAAINTRTRTGRDLCTIMEYELERIPDTLVSKVLKLKIVRKIWGLKLLNGLGIFSRDQSYQRSYLLAGKFDGVQLKTLLPPDKQSLACVGKIDFANVRLGGILGKGLKVDEASFPKLNEESGWKSVYKDDEGLQAFCLER